MRFVLNELGAEQLRVTLGRGAGEHPRSPGGVVLRKSGDCWIIRFDNRKMPIKVSENYITIIADPVTLIDGQSAPETKKIAR